MANQLPCGFQQIGWLQCGDLDGAHCAGDWARVLHYLAHRETEASGQAFEDLPRVGGGRDRSHSEWADEASQLEASGDWKGAIRCRCRELVAVLVQRRLVESVPGRTTGELRQDLSASPSSGRSGVLGSDVVVRAAVVWPSRHRPREESTAFKQLAERVLAAAPELVDAHDARPTQTVLEASARGSSGPQF